MIKNESFILHFEAETYLPLFTRVNSLFFRKRIELQKFLINYEKFNNSYQVEIQFISNKLTAGIIQRQLERLVGIERVKLNSIL